MANKFKKTKIPWNKGKNLSDEHKRKLSESHKGKTSWNKGIPLSDERKKKHSDYMKNYYQNQQHPMQGRKQSKESIEKYVNSRRITLANNPEIRKKFGRNFVGKDPWNKGKLMPKSIRQTMYRITLKEMRDIAKKRGGECLSEEYNGSGNNLKWGCKEGHEWEATPHNIKKDKWCPICSTRIGEKICRSYFEALFNEKFPKKYPTWLKGSKGKNLELDGYCEKLNLAFEYQGEQHYKPLHYFNRNFSLENIKRHDEFKKQKCLENGVTLIQVPYHTDYNKLGKWIEEECNKRRFKPLVNFENIDYRNFDIYSSKSLEEMQNLAKSRNGKCLSDKYINNSTELKWQCEKNHIWMTKPSDVKRKIWCPICYRERARNNWNNQFGTASEFQKKELYNLTKIAKNNGGECLSDRYINAKTRLDWKCKKEHIWRASPDNINTGKWCPKCSYEYRGSLRRGNIKDMQEIAQSKGGRCLSEKYFNVDTKLKWQCGKDHIWEAVPSSIKRGSWCARCVKSKEIKKLD